MVFISANNFTVFKEIVSKLDTLSEGTQLLVCTQEEFIYLISLSLIRHPKITLEWGLEGTLARLFNDSPLVNLKAQGEITSLFLLSAIKVYQDAQRTEKTSQSFSMTQYKLTTCVPPVIYDFLDDMFAYIEEFVV